MGSQHSLNLERKPTALREGGCVYNRLSSASTISSIWRILPSLALHLTLAAVAGCLRIIKDLLHSKITVLIPCSASFRGGISSGKASFQDQVVLCPCVNIARRPNTFMGLCTLIYKCFIGKPLNLIFLNPTTGRDTLWHYTGCGY